jgi:hypothetical protein
MNRLIAMIVFSTVTFSAHAASKYIQCRQSNEKDAVQVIVATIDDDSDKAEVKLYALTADCAKNDSCDTSVYNKQTLPTILRLTLTIATPDATLQRVIDINRTDLSVVSRSSLMISTGNSDTTFTGKCSVTKVDQSKKLL